MQKNNVTVKVEGNMSHEMSGYSPDNELALIVHKQIKGLKKDTGEVVYAPGWQITHKSGWSVITRLATREIALFIAHELGNLANWHNITTENARDWYSNEQNKYWFTALKNAGAWSRLEDVKAAYAREEEAYTIWKAKTQ